MHLWCCYCVGDWMNSVFCCGINYLDRVTGLVEIDNSVNFVTMSITMINYFKMV